MSETSDRLRLLSEVSRRLATFTDLDELVRFATRQARELLKAEGCSLLLLDSGRKEFTFPVASQKESGTVSEADLAEIRFPADRGIAGWVVDHDEAALVTDTANDPRFYDGVDRRTGVQTASLLCAPLRTRSGTIGVIEVINPSANHLNRDDLELLEALASDIGVAHEKAALYEELRGEVINLRQVCGFAGLGFLVLGAALGTAATVAHRARALPLSQLATRRGMVLAILAVGAGLFLVAVARGWILARRSSTRSR